MNKERLSAFAQDLSFKSYLDNLNSSTSCCRSASLLVPILYNNPRRINQQRNYQHHVEKGARDNDVDGGRAQQDPNEILRTLRKWKWLCDSVLVQPWKMKTKTTPAKVKESYSGCINRPTGESTSSSIVDPWYYKCIPTEEDILFIHKKYSLQLPDTTLDVRTELVIHHLQSKSLLVPLTDDATAFILRMLYEMPCIPDKDLFTIQYDQTNDNVNENEHVTTNVKDSSNVCSDPEIYQKATILQKWFQHFGITLIHNCDGNQTVSLSKEIDSFPTSSFSDISANNQSNDKHFTFVDIFAGIGGFRIGMEALGGECIGSCEIDAFARDTYARNFLERQKDKGLNDIETKEFFVNDITRLEIPPNTMDVLCGGFPCQSFSTLASCPSSGSNNDQTTETENEDVATISNLNENRKIHEKRQGGLNTPNKGRLFFHLLRILRNSKPKLFVFENVKGLLHLDNGSHFKKILNLLQDSGYRVTHGVVDASWMLPQRRERVFFVGVRLDLLDAKGASLVRNGMCHDDVKAKLVAFNPEELKKKYQIYANDIMGVATMDRFERALFRCGYLGPESQVEEQKESSPLHPSRLGNFLESKETIALSNSHVFFTSSQWKKVHSQTYLQVHSDGSGQLLTEEDSCAQTLVSSYRQSYLMHSQFVVPCNSVYLSKQKERLVAGALEKKSFKVEVKQRISKDCNDHIQMNPARNATDPTIPRFFTPRECCRLQGFPEHFILPFNTIEHSNDKHQRHLVSHFYRQIGNAVSPPCVAAVAEHAVATFLLPKGGGFSKDSCITSPVLNLVLQASPEPHNIVLGAIERKNRFQE